MLQSSCLLELDVLSTALALGLITPRVPCDLSRILTPILGVNFSSEVNLGAMRRKYAWQHFLNAAVDLAEHRGYFKDATKEAVDACYFLFTGTHLACHDFRILTDALSKLLIVSMSWLRKPPYLP